MMKRQRLKGWSVLLLTLLLIVSVLPVSALAVKEDVVVYDAAALENRSVDEVAKRYCAAIMAGGDTYLDEDASTYYSTPASTVAPYAAGVLTDDTLLFMRSMVNFYRWLAGVDELNEVTHHSNESLQASALVRNFTKNPEVRYKPEDMDPSLWEQGWAENKGFGYRVGGTPKHIMIALMSTGYDVDSKSRSDTGNTGCRDLFLSTDCTDMEFGFSGGVVLVKKTGSGGTMGGKAFAAFPAPGYMPAELVSSPSECSWKVQINSNKIEVDTKAVSVTIKKLSTGKSYTRTVGDNTVWASANSVEFKQPPVEGESYSGCYDGRYSVAISGLKDKATGKAAEIRYTTSFVKMADHASSYPSYIKEMESGISEYMIYETMAGSLDKIAAILPREITATLETGARVTVPVSGAWSIEKTDHTSSYSGNFVNSISADDLPTWVTDRRDLIGQIKIPYKIAYGLNNPGSTFHFYSDRYSADKPVPAGAELEFRIARGRASRDFIRGQIFKLTANSDGSYSSEMAFDTKTAPWKWTDTEEMTFRKRIKEVDSGEYISACYGKPSYGSRTVYVSTDTKTLSVLPCKHVYDEGV